MNEEKILRRNKTFEAIARKYLARNAPDARDQSTPLFLVKALRAASTASSISSDVAAGMSPISDSAKVVFRSSKNVSRKREVYL